MAASRNDDITVIIVNYNYGLYLPEALASVRGQDGGAPRILVVDDESTDPETVRVVDELDRASDVTVIRQPNSGPSAARNRGAAAAATPYVIMLDADDLLTPGALAAMRAPLDADSSVGWAYGHQQFFGAMTGVMRMPAFDPYRTLDRHLIGPTALTRREVFADTGGYDPTFPYYEDWEIWLNAMQHGWRGVRVDVVTHLYRRKNDGKFAQGDRRNYHSSRRHLRRKHAALFARRAEFARQSDLGLLGRMVYRYYWGPRPIPAAVEQGLYRLYFRSTP